MLHYATTWYILLLLRATLVSSETNTKDVKMVMRKDRSNGKRPIRIKADTMLDGMNNKTLFYKTFHVEHENEKPHTTSLRKTPHQCDGCLNKIGVLDFRLQECTSCQSFWENALDILRSIANGDK